MTQNGTLTEQLTMMSDVAIAKFFEHWGTELLDGAVTDVDTIIAGVPADVRDTNGFNDVTDLSADRSLDLTTSALVARAVLLPLANDPEVGPTIAAALETFDDDRLLIDVILALGLVASVLLIVSTTEFNGKIGPFTFHKGKAEPETIKSVLGGVFGLVKR